MYEVWYLADRMCMDKFKNACVDKIRFMHVGYGYSWTVTSGNSRTLTNCRRSLYSSISSRFNLSRIRQSMGGRRAQQANFSSCQQITQLKSSRKYMPYMRPKSNIFKGATKKGSIVTTRGNGKAREPSVSMTTLPLPQRNAAGTRFCSEYATLDSDITPSPSASQGLEPAELSAITGKMMDLPKPNRTGMLCYRKSFRK